MYICTYCGGDLSDSPFNINDNGNNEAFCSEDCFKTYQHINPKITITTQHNTRNVRLFDWITETHGENKLKEILNNYMLDLNTLLKNCVKNKDQNSKINIVQQYGEGKSLLINKHFNCFIEKAQKNTEKTN